MITTISPPSDLPGYTAGPISSSPGHLHTNAHERAEWARMAVALANAGRHEQAARFAKAASTHHNAGMSAAEFDSLQADYRAWLSFGTHPVEC